MNKTKEDLEFDRFIDWIIHNVNTNLEKKAKEHKRLIKAFNKSAGLKKIGAYTFTNVL